MPAPLTTTVSRSLLAQGPAYSPAPLFVGSQALTTSFADAATYTLDPAAFPGASEYRLTATVSGGLDADLIDVGELRTSNSTYQSAILFAHGGWGDEAGNGWFLNRTSAGVTFANPGATLDGNTGTGILGPVFQAQLFTAEFQFTRGRQTAGNEALICQWAATGGTLGWICFLDNANKVNLALADPTLTVRSATGTTAITTSGTHWVAVVCTGTATLVYVDGTREINLAFIPNMYARSGFRVGSDNDGNTPWKGTAFQARVSNSARYTGASYSLPVGTLGADSNTLALWTFGADVPAAPRRGNTGWQPLPAAAVALKVQARNRSAARGTLTGVILEVRRQTASPELVRIQTTPVIPKASGVGTGTWDLTDIATPDPVLDTVTGSTRWVTLYSGYDATNGANGRWTTGLATSPVNAGLQYGGLEGPWTISASSPVFVPNAGTEGYIAGDGSMAIKGSTYYYFYCGAFTPPVSGFEIALATSPDLITWTRQNSGNPIIKGVTQAAELKAKLNPNLLGGAFEGWFLRDVGGTVSDREYFRGLSADGLNWSYQLMVRTPPMSTVNNGACVAINIPGGYRLMADSSDGVPNAGRRQAAGYSGDGGRTFGWRRDRFVHNSDAWEVGQACDSTHVHYLGKCAILYTGATGTSSGQGMGGQIGVAGADWVDDRL